MPAIFSLLSAVLPIGFFVWIVWILDRYDREPIYLVSIHFFWGAFGAVFFGILLSVLTSALLGTNDFLDVVFVAPFVEELTKGALLFLTVRSRQFDNVTDGLVYGMAIGLGFGMTENFLYFLSASSPAEWIFLVIVRTFFSAVMHAMATGTVGAAFGITKFRFPGYSTPIRIGGFLLAMFMHFLWNFSVSVESMGAAGLGMVYIVISVAVILILFQISLNHEKKLILAELTEEAEAGFLPTDHIPYLCRLRTRKNPFWISNGIEKEQYIKLAVTLAFRKAQSRMCRQNEVDSYLEEVDALRGQIAAMLYPPPDTLSDGTKLV
ncbi:MAG: hypothetical protein CL946_04930 [Ectothiorhodospiraceae bacterium]|nr:hypothetical protein [Ectothiorhodospiraceae bacterium]